MSMIQYREASYALHLREGLEQAGTTARAAALVSQALGDLIDHLDERTDRLRADFQRDLAAARREAFDRTVAVTLIVMIVALACGVLITRLGGG